MDDVECDGKPLCILKPIVRDGDEWSVTNMFQMPLSPLAHEDPIKNLRTPHMNKA
jgi:hypothetical protein